MGEVAHGAGRLDPALRLLLAAEFGTLALSVEYPDDAAPLAQLARLDSPG